MVYKLDNADKLCGVTYIDWSKKYSKIPKATCETIKQKCSSGGYYDDAVDLNCEDIKKLIYGEGKPKEINILELMPKVEGKFSGVGYSSDGIIKYVTEQRPEQKEAFERNIITTLKSKLPEGAVVEAVLGEPYYKVGDRYIEGKTNYTLNVRVILNGKVYEQEYNVPHIDNHLVEISDSI